MMMEVKRKGWNINFNLLGQYETFCSLNYAKQKDSKQTLTLLAQHDIDKTCPNMILEVENIVKEDPVDALCNYLAYKTPKTQYERCIKSGTKPEKKESSTKQLKTLGFDPAQFREQLKAELEKEITETLTEELSQKHTVRMKKLQEQKEELQEELDAIGKEFKEYFDQKSKSSEALKKKSDIQTEELKKEVEKLAADKKKLMEERRKFESEKKAASKSTKTTMADSAKIKAEVSVLEKQEFEEQKEVKSLQGQIEKVEQSLEKMRTGDDVKDQIKETKQKIKERQAELADVKKKSKLSGGSAEDRFWEHYFKESLILFNFLREKYTQSCNGPCRRGSKSTRVYTGSPSLGVNKYECIDSDYLRKYKVKCSNAPVGGNNKDIWKDWNPYRRQLYPDLLRGGATFPGKPPRSGRRG